MNAFALFADGRGRVNDYCVHLINALTCWDFKLSDHEKLAELNIPQTLYMPDGDPVSLVTFAWG